jgi:hypothetical protein
VATSNVLAALSKSNRVIVLALEVAGELVPLVKGTISEIRKLTSGSTTATYDVVVKADAAELDAITQLAADDLAAINAELKRLGQPPIPPYDQTPDALPPGVVPITDPSVQGKPKP